MFYQGVPYLLAICVKDSKISSTLLLTTSCCFVDDVTDCLLRRVGFEGVETSVRDDVSVSMLAGD